MFQFWNSVLENGTTHDGYCSDPDHIREITPVERTVVTVCPSDLDDIAPIGTDISHLVHPKRGFTDPACEKGSSYCGTGIKRKVFRVTRKLVTMSSPDTLFPFDAVFSN